jgi:hypothetical protein
LRKNTKLHSLLHYARLQFKLQISNCNLNLDLSPGYDRQIKYIQKEWLNLGIEYNNKK